MLAPCNASREHILADTLLRAANDGYDVSPLIECGADPMASGAPRPIVYPAGAAAGAVRVCACQLRLALRRLMAACG